MPKYIGQKEWSSSIINLIDNLDYDDKVKVFNWIDSDIYCGEESRDGLLETISNLEYQLIDKDEIIADLRSEIATLTDDDLK